MRYLLEPLESPSLKGCFGILHESQEFYAGYICPSNLETVGLGYYLKSADARIIKTIKSIEDAIPALRDFYEKNPPSWEPWQPEWEWKRRRKRKVTR